MINLEKLLLEKVPVDKLLHSNAGAILFFMFQNHLLMAISAVLIFAIGKELGDKYLWNGDCDVYDTVATAIGGALAFLWVYVL